MEAFPYLDFDLLIERAGDRYRARVLNSPGGNASRTFDLPFSREQLQIFVLTATGLGKRRKVRRIESPEMQAIKTFGSQLFEAVFDEEVHDCLRLSLHDTERDGTGLRIRLRLDDSVDGRETRAGATEDDESVALCDVPWEFLYDTGGPGFLCLSSASPVVRYQDLRRPIERIAVQPPLRILVTICGPQRRGRSRRRVRAGEGRTGAGRPGPRRPGDDRLAGAGHPRAIAAPPPTEHVPRVPLHRARRLRPCRQGRRAPLRDGEGQERSRQLGVPASALPEPPDATARGPERVRGRRTDPTDPFAGVAQNLLHGGVNAVIAMQFEISDDAAIVLSSEFYTALADGLPVDAALAEARTAVFTRASAVEWAIPVLYLRSPDAAIFDVQTPVTPRPRREQSPKPKPRPKRPLREWLRTPRGRRAMVASAAALALLTTIGVIAFLADGRPPLPPSGMSLLDSIVYVNGRESPSPPDDNGRTG